MSVPFSTQYYPEPDLNASVTMATLFIVSSAESTANLDYVISLRNNNTSVSYFTPAVAIIPGSTHSILLNLNPATIVELQVNTTGITVGEHEVISGGTETGWASEKLSFTRNTGAYNIQVAFKIDD